MISLTLTDKDAGTVYDLLAIGVDEESSVILTSESEGEEPFKRSHADVQIRLSNMSGIFSQLFTPATANRKYRLVARNENRVLFNGWVENKFTYFDPKNEWVNLTALSTAKTFWEWARKQKYQHWVAGLDGGSQENSYFVSLQSVMRVFLSVPIQQGLIRGFDLGQFSADKIKALLTGDYRAALFTLDGTNTLEEVLTATAIWFNAEISVDPDTETLSWRTRNSIQRVSNIALEDVLREDVEPKCYTADEEKYDWLFWPGSPGGGGPVLTQEQLKHVVGTYYQYDPTTARWNYQILYDNQSPPNLSGNIQSLEVPLRFLTLDRKASTPTTIGMIWDFFGRPSLDRMQALWRDNFIPKRKIICAVDGTDYMPGDVIPFRRNVLGLPMAPGERLMVKRARIDLLKEATDELQIRTVYDPVNYPNPFN